jgi:hypothetical protein
VVDFVFNSDFGLRVINHTVRSTKKHDHYFDIDLDFRKTTKRMFLILHDNRLYIAVNGLSFSDVIFVDDFNESEWYRVEVDKQYTNHPSLQEAMAGVIADGISKNLEAQLNVISDRSSDRIDLTAKLFFKTIYKDGSYCDATNQPRSTKVVYYCDQFAQGRANKQDLKILDISEPDFCTYQIKLATKYLCSAGSLMPKISTKFDQNRAEIKDKKLQALDEDRKT